MTWYEFILQHWCWFVLIPIIYLILGYITTFVYIWYGVKDEIAGIFAFLWPIMLPIAIVIFPSYALYLIFNNLFENH